MEYNNLLNFSDIYLGFSDTKTKIIKLKTNFTLTENFISNPYGSNRLRFQFPDMFTYKLKLDKKEREEYFYTLEVTRYDKPNCKTNSKFFFIEGWKVELRCYNFSKLNLESNFFTNEEIYKYFPRNYANINLDLPTIKYTIKTGIVVPLYSRSKYVEKFFESINKSNLENCIIVLIDESQTQKINDDKIRTHQLIKSFRNNNIIVVKVYKNNHGNMFDSILRGFDFLSNFCEFLVTVDSDVIFKNNWINKLYNLNNIINDKCILTGYNSNLHKVKETFNNYYLKESLGGCNICFKTEYYHNYFRFCLHSYKWDTNISNCANNNNFKIICTNPSVIQHLGIESTGHRKKFGSNKIDKINHDIALDF